MAYTLTLGELSETVKRAYVDTSVLAEYWSVLERADGFPDEILNRLIPFSSSLEKIIASQSNIVSVPEILVEYRAFISSLANKLLYVQGQETPEKKEMGQTVINQHANILRSLGERVRYDPREEIIQEFLVSYRLHRPTTSLFVKRNFKSETSRADASLVSAAILDVEDNGGAMAIVTGDYDIANLVMNFARLYARNLVPTVVKKMAPVNVYFPARDAWRERLSLRHMC